MTNKRPNILFLFTDQLRADCIGALGNSQIQTPNLDRLVREGTTFTQCYTPSPVCMPARHALTSGTAPHLTGCVDNLGIRCERPSFMHGLNELGAEYTRHSLDTADPKFNLLHRLAQQSKIPFHQLKQN